MPAHLTVVLQPHQMLLSLCSSHQRQRLQQMLCQRQMATLQLLSWCCSSTYQAWHSSCWSWLQVCSAAVQANDVQLLG